MPDSGSLWVRLKGKFVRPVSGATGDRRSEAKAVLEADTGHAPEESEIDLEQVEIRRQHHDVEDSDRRP